MGTVTAAIGLVVIVLIIGCMVTWFVQARRSQHGPDE
jgi:hypothetical protein